MTKSDQNRKTGRCRFIVLPHEIRVLSKILNEDKTKKTYSTYKISEYDSHICTTE